MRLIRTGSWSKIVDTPYRDTVYRLLDRDYSYLVEGCWYAPSYKARQWDGKIHLIRKRKDGLVFPSGIFREIDIRLHDAGYEYDVIDQRKSVELSNNPLWLGPKLRPYQTAAASSAITYGGGILNLPPRAGKTLIAAKVIQVLSQKTLFVVPSELLLKQTIRALQEAVGSITVTAYGSGTRDLSGGVVVATLQTLMADRVANRWPIAKQSRTNSGISRQFGVCVFDEVHHLKSQGNSWRNIALDIDAKYKIGLSATVYLNKKGTNEQGAVWLRGICGKVVYSLSATDLIEMGYLVRPTIRFVRHNAPTMPGSKWTRTLYDEGIINCKERNLRIVQEVVKYVHKGKRVLIDVSRIKHIEILVDMLKDSLSPDAVKILRGSTPKAERQATLTAYRKGQVKVVVGTILGEGVDIPELDVVINAEGGKARVSTMQRLRNMTLSDGKTSAVVVEFIDTHHPWLRKWLVERLMIYRDEPGFKIEIEPEEPTRTG